MPRALLVAFSTAAGSAAASTVHIRNTASLQDALVAGTTLLLHEGEYQLSSTLSIPAGVQLRAHDGHDVTLRLAASQPHPVVAIHDSHNTVLSRVRVLGHSPSTASLQQRMAVEVIGGSNHTLDQLTVVGGVAVSGGSAHTITRSKISNPHGASQGNCVYLSKVGDPMSLTPSNHTISHTEIHDCRGLSVPWPSSLDPHPDPHDPYPNITGNGVLLNQVVGAIVSHNFVHDVNYHGIYTQARIHSKYPDPDESPSALNVIELNHIKDIGQCSEQPLCDKYGLSGDHGNGDADPACIYFFDGPLCCYGTEVTNNFCHNTKAGMKGLYLDGDSSGIETSGNVFYNFTGQVIDNNDGKDNHHFGNIAINGKNMGSLTDCNFWPNKDGPLNLSKLVDHTCTPHFWDHYQNYAAFNRTKWVSTFFESPAWKAKFPQIEAWWQKTTWDGPNGAVSCDQKQQFSDCCLFPIGTVANYSIMVNTPAGGMCAHNEEKYCTWYNISNSYCGNTDAFDDPVGCWPDEAQFQVLGPQKLYTSDPGFEDMSAMNFALKPDSQIFKDFPGFPHIPFADIGPQLSLGHGAGSEVESPKLNGIVQI